MPVKIIKQLVRIINNNNALPAVFDQVTQSRLFGLGLTLIYFAVAKLGLMFTSVGENITLIWPPTGLALFALLVFGVRQWPWIFLGALFANLSTGIDAAACLIIAFGNTLEAITGVLLLHMARFDRHLSRIRDVMALVILAAGISTMLSASLGVWSLAFFGVIPWETYSKAWLTWWMGDAMGNLVFAPLLLSWWSAQRLRIMRQRALEAILLLACLATVVHFVFEGALDMWASPFSLLFLSFPFLIWAGTRFGMHGATTLVLLVGTVLLISILKAEGPFAQHETLENMLLLWLYTNLLAITSMVLAAAVSEQRIAERAISHLAQHDHLTGLPNRVALLDRVNRAIYHAQQDQKLFALLYLDIDRFKVLNDSLGHSAGDEVLQEISQRLLASVKPNVTVSRIAGDEFVILIDDINQPEDIYAVTQKIIRAVNEPITVNNLQLHSSVSIGISLYPNDGQEAETLLKHADIAMYRAKDMGRNTAIFYVSEMNACTKQRMHLENELRSALKNNEFALYYQPQYSVRDGRIKSAEALLRWNRADGSCVEPAEFIPLLEETGMIHEVGAWIIEDACRQLAQWRKAGFKNLRISVNLSSLQLKDKRVVQLILSMIAKYRVPAHCLELEITESMLVRHGQGVEETFEQLNKCGVRLAVDDFGTGYSSLSYLHRLSINALKIDRSFIEQIPGNANSEAIARAIVALGKSLNLTLIAEGVENRKQLAFVRELGTDYIQGYLMGKPLTATAFRNLLDTNAKNNPSRHTGTSKLRANG